MREKRRVFVLVLLTGVLMTSMVFASGIVDVFRLSLTNTPASGGGVEPLSPDPTIRIDPTNVINKNLNLTGVSKFNVTIYIDNLSGADLFAWQINLTWNKGYGGQDILNVSRIFSENLMAASTSRNSSSEILGFVTNRTVTGADWHAFAETTLYNVTGVNTGGAIATVEFVVTGYGSTSLTLSLVSDPGLRTRLLDSTRAPITFNIQNGYFRNKWPGDTDGDHDVDFDDFTTLRAWYDYPAGALKALYGYNRECDFEGSFNGKVDFDDFTTLRAWYSYPKGPLNPDP